MATEINSCIKQGDVYIRTTDLIKSFLEDKRTTPEGITVQEYIDETISTLLKYEASILRQYRESKGRY